MTQEPTVTTEIRNILVPVELGASNEGLVRYAAEFAKAFGAKITLMNAWYPPPFSPPDMIIADRQGERHTLWDHIRKKSETQLEPLVQLASELGVEVDSLPVEFGEPAPQILKAIDEEDYDLVIVATHGRRGLSHLLLGSVAEKVVRGSSVPVLVLRGEAEKEFT
jgi:nucleotide-binding universal stress UspA family protein